ncbi:MAG: hypothetical protein PVJ38_02535 [Candidatus Bathyarchaeota archaeon]|jgi:hypothetical protein
MKGFRGTISGPEIQILLNNLGPHLKASYPLDNTPLFEASIEGTEYSFLSLAKASSFKSSGTTETWYKERPNYGDLLGCLIAAGVLGYRNVGELVKRLKILRNLKGRVVYSLDTNLLYYRFLSNTGFLDPGEVALVGSVKNEIEAALNYKYQGWQIREMERDVPFQKHLVRELSNTRMKNSRKAAYLALREYREVRSRCLEVPLVGETGRDKERNDLLMIRSLAEYARENPVYVVVLTSDRLLKDLCEGEGLDYFLLEIPQSIGAPETTPARMADLVALVSGVMGFMKLNNVTIIGEYRGKMGLDELKIEYPGSGAEAFRRDLEVCRRLLKLGVDV